MSARASARAGAGERARGRRGRGAWRRACPTARAEGRDAVGAGSVLAVAMLGVLVVVTVAVGGVVGVVAAHRTAQAAADLAALAGAGAVQDGADPCRRAGEIARRNGSRLQRCTVTGWDVAVVVVADTAHLPGGVLDLSARARAGPVSGLEGGPVGGPAP